MKKLILFSSALFCTVLLANTSFAGGPTKHATHKTTTVHQGDHHTGHATTKSSTVHKGTTASTHRSTAVKPAPRRTTTATSAHKSVK